MAKESVKNTKKKIEEKAKLSNLYKVSDVILPWEEVNDFTEHHQACREAFNPEGKLQEEEVFEIARLHWVKRRLNVGYHKAYLKDLPPSRLKEAEKGGPEAVRAYVEGLEALKLEGRDRAWKFAEEHLGAYQKVQSLLHQLATEADKGNTVNFEHVEELNKISQSYSDERKSLIVPMLTQFADDESEAERQSRPGLIERNTKTNAEIDRQIDKRIARLVNLKEYERLYGKGRTDGACIDVSPLNISKNDS